MPVLTGKQLAEIEARIAEYVLHAGECNVKFIEEGGADGNIALIEFPPNEPHPLKAYCRTEEGRARQRIAHFVIIGIDDTHEPINVQREFQIRNQEQKGGTWCRRFHMMRQDDNFARWLYSLGGDWPARLTGADKKQRETIVETMLRGDLLLKGQSSKQLDHDPELQKRFRETIYEPYTKFVHDRRAEIKRKRENKGESSEPSAAEPGSDDRGEGQAGTGDVGSGAAQSGDVPAQPS